MPEPENTVVSHYRLFVALQVPEPVKTEIERAQEELRRVLPQRGISWTRREQFHLTLRFLGNVETPRVPELIEQLRVACQPLPPMKLRAEHVGCFPDLKFPRVVWIGVQDEAGHLFALQKAVAQAVAAFADNEAEGEFTGHITLARVKHIRRPEAAILAERARHMADSVFGEWVAGQIELMRSEVSPAGARHTCLTAAPLAGPAA